MIIKYFTVKWKLVLNKYSLEVLKQTWPKSSYHIWIIKSKFIIIRI